jgi:penicillin-binding protein 1C
VGAGERPEIPRLTPALSAPGNGGEGRRRRIALCICLALAIAGVLAGGFFVLPPPSLARSRDLSALVLARDGSILRGFLSGDGKWRLPATPDMVDPLYRHMLIAAEDRRFFAHLGVDPLAALRAAGQLLRRGRIVSGASTLTMQAVRLLERRPRTLVAKLAEMGEALALERRLDKQAVLGLYLTLAPFGGNLEGVRAASLAYFGKEPRHLSAAEAALLVALPRAPERLRPDRHPAAARQARDAVLMRMQARGIISRASLAEARAEPVPRRRLPLPFHAPHVAQELHSAHPGSPVERTTIDPMLQREVERLLHREVGALGPQATFAALVIDNRRRAILADVGNADFQSVARRGTLDMTRAVRSPGSALKPLIYAMAFDRLIIHPQTLIDDRPRHFGDYSPGDFDGRFQGEVSAAEALRYSLNVPAVAVLDRLGPGRFTSALAAAGIGLHLPAGDAEPGLAVALGGVGISLFDLATAYGALSQGGRIAPLRVRAEDSRAPGTAIFGPAAAWYVGDILGNAPPPPGMLPAEVGRGRHLAFKTGTSYGFRDAWAVGYDAAVTIAVWAGRPDGTPMPGRTGLMTAAPVLFKIADLLGPAPSAPALPPAGVLRVGNRQLPPALRRLDPAAREGGEPGAGGLTILYPPNGAVVAWDGASLPLEAAGGSAPLRWLVDGRPLPPAAPRRTPYWRPAGVGFVRLTVIDAEGRSARATVRLAKDP